MDGFFKKASHVFGQQLSALFTQIGHMAGGVDSDRYSVHIQMGMGGQILCHARCGAEIVLTASKIDLKFFVPAHGQSQGIGGTDLELSIPGSVDGEREGRGAAIKGDA